MFLPGVAPELAYADEPVVTKTDPEGNPVSSASQPALVATMLDSLDLSPGQRVLEIGAGTGYNAALLRYLTGPDGTVVSLDIDQDIVDQARANLTDAGYPDVTVVCADGALGYPPLAPYQRLTATVGISDLAPAWLEQVTDDALLLVPLDVRGIDLLVAFTRSAAHWASRSVAPCGFIRMRGALADTSRTIKLTGTVHLQVAEAAGTDAHALAAAFAGPSATFAGPSATARGEVLLSGSWDFWKLRAWLATADARYCTVGESLRPGRRPVLTQPLAGGQAWRSTIGLISDDSLAVLTRADGIATGYGPAGAELAADLAGLVRYWHDAGRPGTAGLHVDAYPRSGADQPPTENTLLVDRPNTRFAVYRD